MSGFQTAEVKVYSSESKLGVRLPHPSTCKQAKAAISKYLGLKPRSLSLFGLTLGPLDRPSKKLKDTDVVPLGGDFSFHRWSFDPIKEVKLCREDDVALHLIFCEAKFNYEQRSKMKPTPEQEVELEEFLDPAFTVERQFVELIQKVPGYATYIVHEMVVKEDIMGNACNIPRGTRVQCFLNTDTFSLWSGNGKEKLVEWDWKVVRRWKTEAADTIKFDVCLESGNAPLMKWIAFETRQSGYLFNLASDICDVVTHTDMDQRPAINPAQAGKVQDPLKEFVNGIFHGFTPNFSSIH
jgi:hypothetical protein